MAVHEKETVVVNGERSSPVGWIIGVVIFLLLVLAFFMFGGMDMFDGSESTETINVEAPESVQVQPSN